jgi:hypothetical protein
LQVRPRCVFVADSDVYVGDMTVEC